jgi:hypothetical protein
MSILPFTISAATEADFAPDSSSFDAVVIAADSFLAVPGVPENVNAEIAKLQTVDGRIGKQVVLHHASVPGGV